MAKRPRSMLNRGLPPWLQDQLAEREQEEWGIVPLASNALGLRYGTLQPGPDYALRRDDTEPAQATVISPPSVVERQLRHRIGELVAQQAVEDEGARRMPASQGLYHRYNAILNRCTGNKTRAQMTAPELEAAIGWLERNRLSDHEAMLENDPRYAWTAWQRREWSPPIGRTDGRPRGASSNLRAVGDRHGPP